MASSVGRSSSLAHPLLPDIGRPRMAKADVRNPDTTSWLRFLGQALKLAIAKSGLSHKEAANKIGVDDAELGKQASGARRVHVDRVLAVDELRELFIEELAVLAGARIVKRIEFNKAANL